MTIKNKNKSIAVKNKNKNKTQPKTTNRQNAALNVKNRNDFYKDGANKLLTASIVSSIGLILSAGAAIYSVNHKENNVYFSTNPDGSLIRLIPLGQPNQKNSVVSAWLGKALVDTFDFNFFNIDKRFSESSNKWFTPSGAKLLMKALRESGNLDSIIKNKLIVNLSLNDTPMLVSTQALANDPNRPFSWTFVVDGVLTYRNQTHPYSSKYTFEITVARRSMLEDPTGLGIAQLVMKSTS